MQAKEAQIQEMLQEGKPWNVIAQTLHASKRTIAKVSKAMNEPVSLPPVSQVYEMFDDNKPLTEIVKETNADPVKIAEWFKEWIKMNKGKVFEKFREGYSPTEIVEQTNADTTIISELLDEWIKMNEAWEEGKKYVKQEVGAHEKDGKGAKESEEKRAEWHKQYKRDLGVV